MSTQQFMRTRLGLSTPLAVLARGALGLVLLLGMFGCGGKSGATSVVDYFGFYHPPKWATDHPGQAVQNLKSCLVCHSTSAISQGNGVPNCQTSGCHHSTLPGFKNADIHGARAMQAAGPAGGSLVSCQICHGSDFKGGESFVSCGTCHGVAAPHPAAPWRTPGGLTHANTDPSNAAACAKCHFPGSASNPAGHPPIPAPAGTAPGCFNNTMCHGAGGAPHALGSIWKDATSSAFHGLAAKRDLLYCQACHGTPGTTKFDGGIATTACSSCHTTAKAHSMPWHPAPVGSFPGYVASHRDAGKFTSTCVVCHDVTKGRTAPDPTAPSCFSASYNTVGCHANGPGLANHPVPYLTTAHTKVDAAGFAADCQACHAVSGTSPITAAPLCTTCHQANSPLTTANCASCHTKPPAGTAFPNVAALHPKHEALAGVTGNCGVCHSGADTGSQTHYDHANARAGRNAQRVAPAPAGFLAAYNAKTGNASFNATSQTCSNVSCHGGQTTPSWAGGTINVATQCSACHVSGSSQYNSQNLNGGAHPNHANDACSECHNMTTGANAGATNHFAHLDTQAMEGPADATIMFAADVTGNRSYNSSAKTCTLSCHGEDHVNRSW